ncbi:vacuolar protein sorting-associated protein 26C [Thrips palmi]|uniref:Vacuolar protein sorting-associated protein 26C n=1 Tax=Thrips palmi TaxID=161013 RepID=A0A6P8ZAY1_THRPL|nr:vacuolar protein sorting-associated protein 26C [Thrips palmi]
MAIQLDIKLKKHNKIYSEGENVSGVLAILSQTDFKHDGISLLMEGTVNLQLSAKNVGIFEAFYNSVKPIPLVTSSIDLAMPGKIPAGMTDIPFEFPLKPRSGRSLYETYHGVFVNIQYVVKADLKRSFLNKDLSKSQEFIVEYKTGITGLITAKPEPINFKISPESIQNIKDKAKVPRFLVTGHLDSATCCIGRPLTGELVVERCEVPIKSVELQLVRVETCGCAEGYARDATEVQNIQIGEGNVPCGLAIPIHMVFPRLFTCPTLITNNFKVEFEVNIVIVFQDDHLVTENFPIRLTRF